MVKDQIPSAITEASNVVLPQWLDTFRIILEADPIADVQNPSDWSSLAPRIQIFRVRWSGPTSQSIHLDSISSDLELFPFRTSSYPHTLPSDLLVIGSRTPELASSCVSTIPRRRGRQPAACLYPG